MDNNDITVVNNDHDEKNIPFMEPLRPNTLPSEPIDKKREKFLGILEGAGYNINRIIGGGIFNPDSIWMIVGSPGVVLMFWILGGLISSLGASIYIELGIRSLPKGIGEQRYIDNAFQNRRNLGHIFSFVVIFIIWPGAIIADSYACAQYLFYIFRINPVPKQYFDTDYIALRLMSIAILAFITGYTMCSNRLSVFINQCLAAIKMCAILLISLVGLIKLTEPNTKNWSDMFNSPSAYVGAYSYGILKVINVYNSLCAFNAYSSVVNERPMEVIDAIDELEEPKHRNLKWSNLISVGVSFVLYFLINAAFTTSIGHEFFDENVFNQAIAFDNSIALRFGYKLFNNNETGAMFMSALVAISAFGTVSSTVFVYGRIIKYAAETKFIPKFSELLDNCNNRFSTPFNALIAQFIYCSLFLLFFFDSKKDLFEFFSETSQYLAMIFHGASAICLLRIKDKNYTSMFQIPEWTIVVYLMLVCLIVITSFFPPGPGQLEYYIPNVVSITATLLGGIIWLCRDYPENLQDSKNSEDSGSDEGLEP
ncbi:20483_t:CDS:2 [Gigaspora margarita]|uniref:20483_t:CDS:1 n=1 Tax=Gigaspora margarita TaxID=4874 RepID=A0ABM8VYS4_GIGMA|nr:20483_t:CDS:2 [Gigaspora margarita]